MTATCNKAGQPHRQVPGHLLIPAKADWPTTLSNTLGLVLGRRLFLLASGKVTAQRSKRYASCDARNFQHPLDAAHRSN